MKENIKEFFIAWGVILVINQVAIFGGCFKGYCIAAALPHTGVLAFLWIYFLHKETAKEVEEDKPYKRAKSFTKADQELRQAQYKQQEDSLKKKGDKYEKYIGEKFEIKGDLVIYNGFINGYEDKGVDIVSISSKREEINLVQCKNWTKMAMDIYHIENIYQKLNSYNLSYLNSDVSEIKKHLFFGENFYPNIEDEYAHIQQNKDTYKIRKTLYVSSDKVMDLNIGKSLTMINPNIFRYKDMKIVVQKMV